MGRPRRNDPIAIIGVSLRLPRAETLDALWEHLAAGRSLISEVPRQRWDAEALRGNPAKENKTNSIWGGFIEDADCFDAAFFNISPREASWMDPQQRLALELAWKAVEDAGYRASALAGSRTGVFMGVCHWDYAELIEKHLAHVDAYWPTGIAFSIIANRISHFFDFRGPSIVNDTACAASMTSVYQAVRALQDGECDFALAGGVNLCWSPNHFVAFSKNGMLSKDGRSKAFDERADGYVRGEGGATVLLKPLDKALVDGDPVHAVIRGIGTNHGGRTNSLTVTSPKAQAELIAGVCRAAGVTPDSIDYIEAHGPGTPLGDPIEIAGLKEAFATLAAESETPLTAGGCGIGSIKTNMGHLEGAAGVAGIVKVIAAMRHEALAPNVDFQAINPLIDLTDSPFRIQAELTPWPREADRPRRAGVSSFGFGGSNAHILLEDAPASATVVKSDDGGEAERGIVLPLSAADETRLAVYTAEVLRFVEAAPVDLDLRDLAHTYQTGREAMVARVAFLADDRSSLIEALRAFLAGETGPRVRRPGAKQDASSKGAETADRWVDGEDVDWTVITGEEARRLHAPTYPFARDRHWMDDTLGDKNDGGIVHPILHRNVSGFDGPHFVSRFKGSEFFWAEHHVRDVQVLPGVVCLEMARIAHQQARGGTSFTPLRFENLAWTAPIDAGDGPVTVSVRLRPGSDESTGFVIETPEATAQGVANGQGTVSPLPSGAGAESPDIEAIRSRASERLDPSDCYARLRERGVHHGPTFQAITDLHRGADCVVANLKLPRALSSTIDLYGLHPILLDGAIQAWIGLGDDVPAGAAVPFACRRIDVYGPCERSMLAYIRPVTDVATDGRFVRLDIDLCTADGQPRVAFRELALRLVADAAKPMAKPRPSSEPSGALIYAAGDWIAQPAAASDAVPEREAVVLLAGFPSGTAEEQLAGASGLEVEVLAEDGQADAGMQARAWFGLLHERIAETLRAKSQKDRRFLVLAPASVPGYLTAPLAALLKTARAESPGLEGAVVTVDGDLDAGRLSRIVEAERREETATIEVRHDAKGNRSVRRFGAVEAPVAEDGGSAGLDADGVCWITGGLGGLGRIFVDSLVARGAARIVLSGRRQAPDEDTVRWLDGLQRDGVRALYAPCDVTNSTEVERFVAWIADEVGPLKGVVHAAGVLDDALVLTNTAEKINAVFAPKVAGTLAIDEATRGLDLDFFVLCASVAGAFGNAGQASYAGANAFLDAFADHRAAQVRAGLRRGRTVSIAWPLWADGGMGVDEASLAALNRRFGTVPLPTDVGVEAFETLIRDASSPRWTVLYGDGDRIAAFLEGDGDVGKPSAIAAAAPAPDRLVEDEDLIGPTIGFLKELFADATQMDPAQIKSKRQLDEYGLDSIVIVEMTNRLEEKLGPLSKTLFFEYVDLAGIAAHLIDEHRAALAALFVESPAEPANPAESVEDEPGPAAPERDGTGDLPRAAPRRAADDRHDIAIVGLSLRVSKAADQKTFWELLANGRHGFERYPSSRWNHDALLHSERDVLGKTVVKTGAFIDGVDEFDPRYFRISQYEAELMSPEVRLFLQTSVEAFEDAGYSRETLQSRYDGDVAVIVGSMTNEYDYFGFQNMLVRGAPASGSYTGTVPNMVSYFYGFTGPSYFLDTMCSTSSTCVHEAVHMLRAGRCKMALAGGVSLLLHPQKLIATSQEHFTTKTAEVIRGYGLGADGTIVGEGVGGLVLKTVADAERDGDHIYAVIKGTDVSNAGVRNGFTVPTPAQQARAIEGALADAAIDPSTLGYIEGHGSGTSLGDPIEIKALTRAFGKYTSDVQICPIGTVKSNIAHLLAAAGVAGIVKVLLQMAHGQIAPSLHADTLNPNIPFAETPFYVQRELAPWPRKRDAEGRELPRRAGVTSIGAGGMNSHIILEEYQGSEASRQTPEGPDLLVFSAMTETALKTVIQRFIAHADEHPSLPLADVAYTLQVGKNELPCRLALVAGDLASAKRMLSAFLDAPGPGTDLFYTRSILDKEPSMKAAELRELTRRRDLGRLAQAWTDGEVIDWELLNDGRECRRLSLPAYPFERVRCWYPEFPDAPSVLHPLGSSLKLHPFVGSNKSGLEGLRYTTAIHLSELLDYVYTVKRQQTVLPTVALDLMAALARIAGRKGPVSLRGLSVRPPLTWADVAALDCTVTSQPEGAGLRIVVRMEDADGDRRDYATAVADEISAPAGPEVVLDSLRAGAVRSLDRAAFYETFAGKGLSFGPYLEVVERADVLEDGSLLCALRADPPQQDPFKRNVLLSAPLLGAVHQALVFLFADAAMPGEMSLVEARLGEGDATQVLVRPTGEARCDVLFLDDHGRAVASLDGLDLRAGQSVAMPAETEPAELRRVAAADPGPIVGGDRRARIERDLREIAAGVLKFDTEEIDPRALFYELGFDSISLTRLANEIGAAYGIDLSAAVFFECEHIEALSAHLVGRHDVTPLRDAPGETATPIPIPAAARSERISETPPSPTAETTEPVAGSSASPDAVAIVGMAGRFPGSATVDAFYDHLLAGDDLIADLPRQRYGGAYRARVLGADFVKRGGFLDDIDRFDAAFFKISPVEAERMDPQQRLMLETMWRVLEDAGYRPDELPTDTGVCVGVSGLDYADLLKAHGVARDGYAATGNSLAMVANRISHFLNLHGPSQAVDTACSSSLVALLRGADMLRSGRCGAVLVGGVNLALSIEGFEGPQQAGMLSPAGKCKTFGKDADGYVRGEGVVAVMVKRLRDAERDGDRILGVVAGGAENHGGRAGSLTAPNAKAQADLVCRAMSGIDAAGIDYIEAHGTGTGLGDPVEVNGLRLAYETLLKGAVPDSPFIGLGSVKSNIGHLEAAAGLAGVVKVLMAMRRSALPPTLHCREVNPLIELEGTPFYLVRSQQSWPRRRNETPRRAAVSSFGFGGTNAHVVLEDYRQPEGTVRRAPLKPRSFAETRYWIPDGADTSAAVEPAPVLMTPRWVEAPLKVLASPKSCRRIVVSCEVEIAPSADVHVVSAPSLTAGDIASRYRAMARLLLETLQRALRDPDRPDLLVQLVVPRGDERELHAGLAAMLDTAAAENPRVTGQLIEVPSSTDGGALIRLLAEEAKGPLDRRVRYDGDRRRVRAWHELSIEATEQSWRADGVYVVSGGMGALGRLVARDIAERAPGATIILTGSSGLDTERTGFLESLRETGATAEYRQADLADEGATVDLVRRVLADHGTITGVIHCAGVIRDSYLVSKTVDQLEAVLAPKVDGLCALEKACRDIPLEVFVVFSSLAGAVGNPGQADYAAANGFLDAFAARLGAPLVAIDWALWRDGGMTVDDETGEMLFRRMGQRPLPTAQGLAALHRAVASGEREVAVVAGEADRIRAFFAAVDRPAIDSEDMPEPNGRDVDASVLEDRTTEKLRPLFAGISGVPAERIAADVLLEEYGIDSLMITRLNKELGDIFGALSKTLLFECRTLADLGRYLVRHHAAACARWAGVDAEVPAAPVSPPREAPVAQAKQPVAASEPIAIIGMSGRYPGASDLDRYWDNLSSGRDAIRDVPADRWNSEGFFHADPDEAVAQGMSYTRRGGFIDGFAEFDPLLFGISPRDAAAMDPQERLFLTSAWEACEDAGYPRNRLAERHDSRVGVFVGITKTGFALHGPYTTSEGARVVPRTSFAGAANRVSHVLNLNGPSLPVDTMCSSSLTAIHEACESLRAGTCELALAGGVNLYLHPSTYVELCASHMLSADGRCKSFGKGADGFVPGEGVGCFLLKPLSRAQADGDRIHAVIRGSAVNHGGKTNGYTVPNPTAQREVIRAALDRAGLSARDVTCIEAHGTGTELGDPIEVSGLTQAFRADTTDSGFCALGSVKSAIGHLEAAAGIAGLTKAVLQLKHRTLAPTLHAGEVNPNIDFAQSPFVLQQTLADWRAERRIAGVSSFGAGGANAHVVVEEWPTPSFPQPGLSPAPVASRHQAIVLSARDADRLREAAERLLAFVERDGNAEPQPHADAADLVSAMRDHLAGLLSVAPRDIDSGEPFDAYGVGMSHRLALRDWIAERFPGALDEATVRHAVTLDQLAGMMAGATPTAKADGPSLADSGPALADIAYTLQIGREAMDARLAFEADSFEMAAACLRAYLDGRLDDPGLRVGTVRDLRDALSPFLHDAEMAGVVRRWVEQGRLDKLLDVWVKGFDVDWSALPRAGQPQVVSLPTYPFARERYWPISAQAADDVDPAVAEAIRATTADGRYERLREAFETLERRLAPLIREILRGVPKSSMTPDGARWSAAMEGLLECSGGDGGLDAAWSDWEAFKHEAADDGPLAQIILAETALRDLPAILTGERRATAVLFPSGGLDLVEAVYKRNAVAERFNRTVAAAARTFVRERLRREPARPLRILEIGAGTGATTEVVLEALAPHADGIAEYRYTDVSKAFLIHAERRFAADVPHLATTLFDVEKPPAEQEIETAAYDLVIAANVLHATADMRRTLSHVSATLAPGGLLLVNEVSRPTVFTQATFGLLEGWWRATDTEVRISGSPCLTPDSWKDTLEAAGFRWVAGSPGHDLALGQQVIAAVRQKTADTPQRAAAALPSRTRSEPAVAAVPEEPADTDSTLRDLLLRLLAETLNVPRSSIGVTDSFADYGLDSILGAELVHKISRALGVALDQTLLFDFTTVAQFETFLAAEHPQAVAAALASGPATEPVEPAVRPRSRPSGARPTGREPIAVVGASGRFAKSATIEELWSHLLAGRDLVEPVSRFDLASFYKDVPPETYGRHGSFIDGVELFDPVFFGISGIEATYMDPQQRLFLEEAWKALEIAGHAGADIEGTRCGVFVGCSSGDYHDLFRAQPPGQAFWGNTGSLIPARIAYSLNLKGPAIAVDTACSSSLVAIHLACQSLWSGESDMALAGGVFVQATARFYRYANQANMLSPSGRCAAFGEGADGIVPGEAVAAVLLRPLADALADGDTVLGVIAGSGTNQDGTTNGITAPSAASQESLIRRVYDEFGIDPETIGLVEAHGTGTVLGDPIEHAALTRAFGALTDRTGFCALGSVKANIGHATTAAGVAGFLKALWSIRDGRIPPLTHFGSGNPKIRFEGSPFYANTDVRDWPQSGDIPRRAAVSSFGFSGTNAHVVVEGAPPQPAIASNTSASLIVLSARTAAQLKQQAERLVAHLAGAPASDCADVAYTLLVGRKHWHHRLAVVVCDTADLTARLKAWLAGDAASGVETAELDEKDHREDADRTATGNALIDALRRDAAMDEAAYGERLREVGRFYLAGNGLRFADLFDGQRRRIPLPTYPFAAKRHWVAEVPEPQRSPIPSDAGPSPAKAAVTRLDDPAALAVSPPAAPASPAKVSLAPLTALRDETRETVRRLPDADGVRHIELLGTWSATTRRRLAEEIAALTGDQTVRAVLVSGTDGWRGTGETPPADDDEALFRCPVPTVAALGGAADDGGLRFALRADFCIVAEEGCHDDMQGAGIRIVPAAQVVSEARALAREIAGGPREALVELTRHLRNGDPASGLLPAHESRMLALAEPANGGAAASPGSSRKLPLMTDIMELEAFDDGVMVLRMADRDGRNGFTDVFDRGLTEAFDAVRRLPEAKVVVLTGCDAYFASGGTRDGLAALQRGEARFTDNRTYSLPLTCELPVIAAMQGHAIGAGWALGMYCDIALFAAERVYHSNYLRFGFTPGAGATLVVPDRLGDRLGREVLFSAREYKGRELSERRAGLLVAPSAEVLPRALAMAHRLAAEPRDRLMAEKARLAAALAEPVEQTLARELAMHEKTLVGNRRVLERIEQLIPAAPAAPVAAAPSGSASRETVREAVVATLAEELQIDPEEIRETASFLDLGLDSILAVTWIRRLNGQFGIELPATAVYAHPTVGRLVDHLASLMPADPGETAPPRPAGEPAEVPAVAPAVAETGAPRGAVGEAVIASLAEELQVDAGEIREGAAFLDLGLDSILAVTWIRRLNGRFGIELPATAVYAHPTVGRLIDHVASLVPAGFGADVPRPPAEPESSPARDEAAEPVQPAAVFGTDGASRRRGDDDAVAIIGASGAFPKAATLEAFWDNIRSGRDCIDEVPPERWDIARHYDPDPQVPDKSYCKWMGSLDGVDLFDPLFFQITPREAELMDPQQRLFLQHTWQAFEDAALDPSRLAGTRCGVFAASGPSGYADLIHERNSYSLMNSSGSILAARIAHLLDLWGPCLSVDTACSSSLVAIVEACNSLLLGDSDIALAGGACVMIGPSMFIDTSKVSMLSKEGRCFTFDNRADGFVPGEGVGVVVLKRLADAERDGDPIRAVVRGWGMNQDGKTNGIMAPNPQAQTRLLRTVQERFGIDPATIGLVEAHGTGTKLGDPIEIEGLTDAFAEAPASRSCALGSVKSNVGHLLAAAGVAGAIKAMLAVEQGELPPTINFETQNGNIDLEGTPFFVNTELRPWPAADGQPRRAAVNSFGFSGTNAHVVLEAYPGVAAAAQATPGPQLFVLSARTPDRLKAYAEAMLRFVETRPDLDLGAFAHTLRTARTAFDQRLAFVFADREALLRNLWAASAGDALPEGYGGGLDRRAVELFEADADARALAGKWLESGAPDKLDRLAELWVKRLDVDWSRGAGGTASRRIRIPTYPFARERYWVSSDAAAEAPAAMPPVREVSNPTDEIAIPEAEGSATHAVLYGDEPFLTHHVAGEERLLLGLFLPEMARAVATATAGRTVSALRHLVWGRPVRVNGEPRTLGVEITQTADGFLYNVCADGEEDTPCHLGEIIVDGADVAWPGPMEAEERTGDEMTGPYRRSAERYAVYSGPAAPEAADVREVYHRRDGEWVARLSRPSSSGEEGPGACFDPLYLDAIWRLVSFVGGSDAGLVFPYAIETLACRGPLPDELWVRIAPDPGAPGGDSLTIAAFEPGGVPCLVLRGVIVKPLDDLAEIRFEEEALP